MKTTKPLTRDERAELNRLRLTAQQLILRAGNLELDRIGRRLRRLGKPVALRPKPLALLELLMLQPDKVLTYQELMAALWPGNARAYNNLRWCLSTLRAALGADSVRTVRGQGCTLQARGDK